MAIAGKVGAVYTSKDTAPVSFTDEITTPDMERKRFQITDPALRYWPPEEQIAVEVDGDPVTTGFTLERAGGVVVFAQAQEAGAVVTVSGKSLTVEQSGGFFNWSIDGDSDDADATTFKSGGWKEFVSALKGWSGSAEAYFGDENFARSVGKTVVVKLYIDAGPAQDCLEGFALIIGDNIEAPVEGVVTETVEFTGVGPLYLRI